MNKKYIIVIDYLATVDRPVSDTRYEHVKNRYAKRIDNFNESFPTEDERKNSQSFVNDNLAYIYPTEKNTNLDLLGVSLSRKLERIGPREVKIIINGHGSPKDKKSIYASSDATGVPLRSINTMAEEFGNLFKHVAPLFNYPGPSISLDICYSARTQSYEKDHSIYDPFPYCFRKTTMSMSGEKYTSLAYLLADAIRKHGFHNFKLSGRMTPMKTDIVDNTSTFVSINEKDCKLSLELERKIYDYKFFFDQANIPIEDQIETNNAIKTHAILNTKTHEILTSDLGLNLETVQSVNTKDFIREVKDNMKKLAPEALPDIVSQNFNKFGEYAALSYLKQMNDVYISEMELTKGQKTIWVCQNKTLQETYKKSIRL